MSTKLISEKINISNLQYYHHSWFNNFDPNLTFIESISERPGFSGHNPIAFLSLLARKPNFYHKDLVDYVINDKSLIRVPAFRGSLSLIPYNDYSAILKAYNQYFTQRSQTRLKACGISKDHLRYFINQLNEGLGHNSVTFDSIVKLIFENFKSIPTLEIQKTVINCLCDLGVLIRTSTKAWKSNDFYFALANKWFSEHSTQVESPEIARTEIIRKYIKAYGPVSMEDIVFWTGFRLSQCQRSVGQLRRESIRFKVEGYKEDLIGLKECVELIHSKNEITNPVTLLPPWDPYTLGWLSKKRLMEKAYLPYVFDKNGNCTSVILYLGKIVGVWQIRDVNTTLFEFCLFEKSRELVSCLKQKIEEFCNCLINLYGSEKIDIYEKPLPKCHINDYTETSIFWPLGRSKTPLSSIVANEERPYLKREVNTLRKSYLDNEYLVKPIGVEY